MMTKIKYALAFLLGCLYSSSWWSLFVLSSNLAAIPIIVIIAGTVILGGSVVCTFAQHWDDK